MSRYIGSFLLGGRGALSLSTHIIFTFFDQFSRFLLRMGQHHRQIRVLFFQLSDCDRFRLKLFSQIVSFLEQLLYSLFNIITPFTNSSLHSRSPCLHAKHLWAPHSFVKARLACPLSPYGKAVIPWFFWLFLPPVSFSLSSLAADYTFAPSGNRFVEKPDE